jgi:hypothetical protein
LVIALLVLGVSNSLAGQPIGTDSRGNDSAWHYSEACANIESGTLLTPDGDEIAIGFDERGYNYQGRMFSGSFCDAYGDEALCQLFEGIDLLMQWNDQWLSNEDCDGDRLLDLHRGFDSYIGSGAWVTNQMTGEYLDEEGNPCQLSSFAKIVAVPVDAVLKDGIWYTAGNDLIGANILGEFAITMAIYSDTCSGEHPVLYASPDGVGFGPGQ